MRGAHPLPFQRDSNHECEREYADRRVAARTIMGACSCWLEPEIARFSIHIGLVRVSCELLCLFKQAHLRVKQAHLCEKRERRGYTRATSIELTSCAKAQLLPTWRRCSTASTLGWEEDKQGKGVGGTWQRS